MFGTSGKKMTIHLPLDNTRASRNDNPGPGTYSFESLKMGRPSSSRPNSGSMVMRPDNIPDRRSIIKKPKDITPDPGAYNCIKPIGDMPTRPSLGAKWSTMKEN